MNKEAIKKAQLEFYKDLDNDPTRIECDIDFALSLAREDIIWIYGDSTPENFPYLKATTEQLNFLADGFYVVVVRTIIWGNVLQIAMEEAHVEDMSSFKSRFMHLSMFGRWE